MQHRETNFLLDQAQRGSVMATERLLDLYRDKLARMVAVLLDRRLSSRLDAEDIVQDALLVAALRLPGYLENRPIAFFPWLKALAVRELIRARRQHLEAQQRSVYREQRGNPFGAKAGVNRLDVRIPSREPSPTLQAMATEDRARVRQALNYLNKSEREILWKRYQQQLTLPAIAAEMQVSEPAAKSRLRRAHHSARRLLQQRRCQL